MTINMISYFPVQALRTLLHTEGAKCFSKGKLQGRLKQLNLEEDPGHNAG